MKILFIQSTIHHKNLNFILNCKNIQFTIINSVNEINNYDLSTFDAVYSPCQSIDVSKYPETKFIFGPQFSVFPEDRLSIIKGPKTVYNLLSNWVTNIWKKYSICNDLKLIELPFGVDTEKFVNTKSITEKNEVIVYFKHRNPVDLQIVENFLINKEISYNIFSYDARYNEENYLECLQNAKYCIWVDAHESQGFALQEALSCDVPLLVWNITSMNQEFGSCYSNLPATTIPYWDERCGEYFYNVNELDNTFNTFISKLETYKPREFIVENLSVKVCENKLVELINNM